MPPSAPADDIVEARASQLLLRYGIVFPEVLARESTAPPWRALLRVYRRAEARGEIRGGRFVTGFAGEQFALPEALDSLRALRKVDPDRRLTVVSGSDPLNLAGILTPGPRVPAQLGNRVVFRDGVPVASVRGSSMEFHAEVDEETRTAVIERLGPQRRNLNGVQPESAVPASSTR